MLFLFFILLNKTCLCCSYSDGFENICFFFYHQRPGIATGDRFYNARPGTTAWLCFVDQVKIFWWALFVEPNPKLVSTKLFFSKTV